MKIEVYDQIIDHFNTDYYFSLPFFELASMENNGDENDVAINFIDCNNVEYYIDCLNDKFVIASDCDFKDKLITFSTVEQLIEYIDQHVKEN